MIKKIFIWLFVAGLVSIGVIVTFVLLMYKTMGKGTVTIPSNWIEIPYEYTYSGHIKIYVDIDGKKYPFIVDSGASNILFGDRHDLSSGLKWFGIGADSNGDFFFTKIKGVNKIEIGNLLGTDLNFKIQEYDQSCPDESIGIIGKETMRHQVWQFFPERKIIRIAKNQEHTVHYATEDTIGLALNKSSNHLYIHFGLEDRKSKRYIVDTGSNGFITTPIDESWDTSKGEKRLGRAGKGLSSIDTTGSYLFKVDYLTLKGGDTLNIPVSVNVRNSSFKALGIAFLKNFNFTVDWQNRQLILSPLENQRFISGGYGVSFNINEEQDLYISSLLEGSLAFNEGLEVNQKILSLNDIFSSELDACSLVSLINESDTLKIVSEKGGAMDSVEVYRTTYF